MIIRKGVLARRLATTLPRILVPAVAFATLFFNVSVIHAGEWELSGFMSGEMRTFFDDPVVAGRSDASVSSSFAAEPALQYRADGGDQLTLVPFARWDEDDENRTHVDVREANWLHVAQNWDAVIGLDRVFWGVTESVHLVDIINQFDSVEDIDNEDKLGQPMVNINIARPNQTARLYLLPGFRERTFPEFGARLSRGLRIDEDNPVYESSSEEWHPDVAGRWEVNFRAIDMGVAGFYGTSREPRLVPTALPDGSAGLVPHYDLIDQASLDLQLTLDTVLWKLEAMTRGGQGDRFVAAVGGLEFTLFGVFGSSADIGILAEYVYDGRDQIRAPATPADDDIFLGLRLTPNDRADTAFLMGAIIDRNTQATLVSIESERRIGAGWKVELESRLFLSVPVADVLSSARNDDFVTLRLSRFF